MHDDKLREALRQIARLAQEAIGPDVGHDRAAAQPGCVIRALPLDQVEEAAQQAVKINPFNSPNIGALGQLFAHAEPPKEFIAVVTTKYWGFGPRRLTVQFLDNPTAACRRRIMQHLNAWNSRCGIEFMETGGFGQVRITTGPGGYWSYLGTDILSPSIAPNQPTMNLQDFTEHTAEKEYLRVVRHEAGHTLGFPHEHMRRELVARINPQRAYEWFWQNYRWNQRTVNEQVLTPLDDRTLYRTPIDQTSIMCYKLPGSITHDGEPIIGGDDINGTDYAFAAEIYPKR